MKTYKLVVSKKENLECKIQLHGQVGKTSNTWKVVVIVVWPELMERNLKKRQVVGALRKVMRVKHMNLQVWQNQLERVVWHFMME